MYKIRVVFNEDAFEAVLKYRSEVFVFLIKIHGIAGRKRGHNFGYWCCSGLDGNVEMIWHEAECIDRVIVLIFDFYNSTNKEFVIIWLEKNILFVDAAVIDMEE